MRTSAVFLSLDFQSQISRCHVVTHCWPRPMHFADAVATVQVRGAPAIAIVGLLGLAAELLPRSFSSASVLRDHVHQRLDYLVTSRPTAVNLSAACSAAKKLVDKAVADGLPADEAKRLYVLQRLAVALASEQHF